MTVMLSLRILSCQLLQNNLDVHWDTFSISFGVHVDEYQRLRSRTLFRVFLHSKSLKKHTPLITRKIYIQYRWIVHWINGKSNKLQRKICEIITNLLQTHDCKHFGRRLDSNLQPQNEYLSITHSVLSALTHHLQTSFYTTHIVCMYLWFCVC